MSEAEEQELTNGRFMQWPLIPSSLQIQTHDAHIEQMHSFVNSYN